MNMKPTIWITLVLCLTLAGGELRADDTEIYGSVAISVEPNVLIIFDTSGSMGTNDIPSEYYDPATTYAGSYTTNAVYRRTWVWGSGYVWNLFADDIDDILCTSVKNDLLSDGYDRARIDSGDYTCGGTRKTLHIGNYRNYDEAGLGTLSTRISVAQEVIVNLINDTSGVRFGLMRFNTSGDGDENSSDDDGGSIVSDCGTAAATLVSQVNAFTASGYTPLAETLAEAGLYFGGKSSWFNAGTTYTSPIEERCRKNFVILMTDGEPTMDSDPDLSSRTYINGDTIGDYDSDGNDPGSYSSDGSDYLDDVAEYLYENDISTLGSVGDFEKQNVITYTIGFKTEQQLLQDTATNGGGAYYTANNISGLAEAFTEIMAAIQEDNAVFVSPVVPVSRMNRTYAGNYIYVGFFKPQPTGGWIGNLKKYGLDTDGNMIDANGDEATTSTGAIKDNAVSYWSTSADGPNVMAGGVGEVLLEQATRNIYTYMGTQADLTHADNAFSTDNALITNAVMGVSTDAERETTIDTVYDGEVGSWVMGDILHSQPVVMHYDTNGDDVLDATYIFSGNNDGMIHCFSDDTGSEVWAFIPPDQLDRLQLLTDNNYDYFVDGSPVIYEDADTDQKILLIGERRGGNNYYALDVTTPTSPSWLYKIEPSLLGGGAAQLGQSWSRPETGEMKTGGDSDMVFLMAGGYDTNQDLDAPAADTVGRAVFAVDVTDGSLSVLDFNAGNFADMTHCIVDVTGFDSKGDGYLNRAYAGDLGGNMFAFENDELDGSWSAVKLFSAPGGQKIFYAPDAVNEEFAAGELGEYIYFGTGDRADPEETGVVNRFYAVKNNWVDSGLTEDDLVDVTDDLIQLGTAEQKEAVATNLLEKNGWYIRLENTGEKVTSTPIVYGGEVYFTTYTPTAAGGPDPTDPCGVNTARGVARLYAVDYLTGGSIHNYDPTEEIDQETGEAAELGKLDRVVTIGTSIASAPVIAILESGPQMYIGVEGGIVKADTGSKVEMNIYYWRQIF